MKIRNIAVVTGTRADFNYLRLIIRRIEASETLKLSLIVTGMHLLKSHGYTIDLIRDDKIPITEVIEMYEENNSTKESLGKAVGKGIIGFTKSLNKIKPDLLLVLGDRYEVLASVIAASTLLIPIAHIHGGDSNLQGQVDEQIRHSITKFSHIHFPATEKSAKRINLMGEEEWRIHEVGSPSIDHFYLEKFLKKEEICESLGLNSNMNIIICIQHPYTIEPEKSGEYMRMTLKALEELNLQVVIIYPNNDPGNELIIKEIEKYKEHQNFRIFKNLDYHHFYSLIANANLLIGNSSAGLIESPVFKIPVINIGDRNKGRESAENVLNVQHDLNLIKNAIKTALSEDFILSCDNLKNPYGDGKASERIIEILEKIEIDKKLLVKKLTY